MSLSVLSFFIISSLIFIIECSDYPYDWCLIPGSEAEYPVWYQLPYEKYADLVLNVDPICAVGYTKVNQACTDICNDLVYVQNDPVFKLAELYERNNTGTC